MGSIMGRAWETSFSTQAHFTAKVTGRCNETKNMMGGAYRKGIQKKGGGKTREQEGRTGLVDDKGTPLTLGLSNPPL